MRGTVAVRALAGIRLANGALGLFAPALLLRRLGSDPRTVPVAMYPFRMFGIRTVVLGADLLLLRGPELERAVRTAVLIHGSDTVSAAVGGLRQEVPRRVGILTTAISAVNTLLAAFAWRQRVWKEQR